METIVQLSRDPFARTTLVRRVVNKPECAECCGKGRFEYGSQPDGGRTYWSGRAFCSVGCYRAYYS